jgi:heme-degrading monooxygenase HmoA
MTVKILIKRKVTDETISGLEYLLNKLRSQTITQKGYISGESLVSGDDKNLCLVISTWKSLQDWKKWFSSPERLEIQNQIDHLIGEPTH